jgi:DNA mismatch repair protein MutL
VRLGEPETVRVAEDAADYTVESRRLPPLRLLGQLARAFMLAESAEGLVLIDQHRAHERVLFERLAAEIAGGGAATQYLLHPFALELTVGQAELIDAHLAELERLGLVMERFGPLTWLVRGVPGVVASAPREVVGPALERAVADGFAPAALERLALDLACRSALRTGRRLSSAEMRELLLQLGATRQPYLCPHGGPIVLEIDRATLEQQFGRRLAR